MQLELTIIHTTYREKLGQVKSVSVLLTVLCLHNIAVAARWPRISLGYALLATAQ
jgi:hypothetical protein